MSDGLLKLLVDFLPLIIFVAVFLLFMRRSAGRYSDYMVKAEAFMERHEQQQAQLIESNRAIAASLGEIKRLLEEKKN